MFASDGLISSCRTGAPSTLSEKTKHVPIVSWYSPISFNLLSMTKIGFCVSKPSSKWDVFNPIQKVPESQAINGEYLQQKHIQKSNIISLRKIYENQASQMARPKLLLQACNSLNVCTCSKKEKRNREETAASAIYYW
eukprot:TRINITY_DN11648_c0_g1_i3.p1 TRINITY_DN11648_c0_g1~~TRINITY_DN11648_c0_g1_i3.p1  ORF type:complete len:138 (-),score=20.09 TRINITY_DN11648_c0_g1_i3:987-1400(-)